MSLNNFPKPLIQFIRIIQHQFILKTTPYYAGVLFYSNQTTPLYLINLRINQYLLKFLVLPILCMLARSKHQMLPIDQNLKINSVTYPIIRLKNYSMIFHKNLCLIADTNAKLECFFYKKDTILSPNLLLMRSQLKPKSDIILILDNRSKIYRFGQKYLDRSKFSLATALEENFYRTINQRFQIYSDSIVVSGTRLIL